MSCRTRGMEHVQRVAAAGEVHVVARILRRQAVIGGVVHAAHGQRRPHLVALGRVVVDDVEDDFESGGVQAAHHQLELLHRLARPSVRGVFGVRREKAQRVVAPVIGQPLLDEMAVVEMIMHGHQLDGGDAEVEQVLDGGLRSQAGVGAAQLFGHAGHSLGEALDVQLVDQRLVPGRVRRPIVAPGEGRYRRRRPAGRRRRCPVRRRTGPPSGRRPCSRTASRARSGRGRWPWHRDRATACCGLKRMALGRLIRTWTR